MVARRVSEARNAWHSLLMSAFLANASGFQLPRLRIGLGVGFELLLAAVQISERFTHKSAILFFFLENPRPIGRLRRNPFFVNLFPFLDILDSDDR